MHRESGTLRHVVVHDTEDALLHLSGVGAAQDNLFLGCEVHIDCVLASDIRDLVIGAELARIKDCEVGAIGEVLLNLILRSPLKHILHEQSVVRAGRDNASLELIAGVPASILVDNEDALPHVQEVNSSGSVHGEGFRRARNIDGAPMHFL